MVAQDAGGVGRLDVPSTRTSIRSTGPGTVMVLTASPPPSTKPAPKTAPSAATVQGNTVCPPFDTGVRRWLWVTKRIGLSNGRAVRGGPTGASTGPKVAVGHVLAEVGVLVDEAGEELVQPFLDDVLDLGLGELAEHGVLRRSCAGVRLP